MKKLTKVGVLSVANVVGLLGSFTGAVKVVILPVLALLAAGTLGDVDSAVNTIGETVSKSVSNILGFGIVGWLGGWVYAWLLNHVLRWTNGLDWEVK